MRLNPIAQPSPILHPPSSIPQTQDPIPNNANAPATDILPKPKTPSPIPQSPLKKVSFGKIATKKEDTKTAYPVFADANGQAAEIAARIIERTEQFEALNGALETDKAELKQMVTPFYFQANHGRHEVPSSISVKATVPVQVAGRLTGEAREVLVTFQNRYTALPDESPLLSVLGDSVGNYFRQAFEFKIVGDKLPEAAAQDIIDDLQQVFGRHNCLDALEVKSNIKPTAEFHAARHLQLTPEQNLAIEQACPIVAMIKTKGRK